MKNLLSLVFLCVSLMAMAQKDKAENVFFNSENDVVVVFKSGTVALYSNPDLELVKEASPGDKKNKNSGAKMTPSGNHLMVYDGKVKKVIYYDAKTLEEKNRQDLDGLPVVAGENSIYSDGKILSVPDLGVVNDISGHDRPEEGIIFSPSAQYYLNYEPGGTGGDGDFAIFETETGNSLGKSQIGDNKSEYVLTNLSYFTEDDSVALVYQIFMGTDYYMWKVPVKMGDDYGASVEEKTRPYETSDTEVDYDNLQVVSGDFAADVSDDYNFYGMSAVQRATEDNKYLVMSTPQNKIRLYQNDPSTSEKQGDLKKSTLLKEIEIPSE